ncbi:MAG TPA: cobalamin-dependent protein [Candidatus Anoxymicrobiaceae bacterium]|jgi:methanogenic corrinoid protein MtbC1
MAGEIGNLLVELEEDKVLDSVRASLNDGVKPMAVVEELRNGMSEIGKRFEAREYYLSELIMSAEIFKQAMEIIETRLDGASQATKGTVVLGTVQGDIHDIGKNIVASILRCEGFEVHDLGVDVPPEKFVAKLEETGAGLLALSGLLTIAFDTMKTTVEAVTAAGLRDRVRVIIGGGPVNEAVVEFTGADTFGKDAAEAVRLAARYAG